jgi:hypothetical protein
MDAVSPAKVAVIRSFRTLRRVRRLQYRATQKLTIVSLGRSAINSGFRRYADAAAFAGIYLSSALASLKCAVILENLLKIPDHSKGRVLSYYHSSHATN